eukprot:SAG25_NODE_2581_length_1516_cov_51.056966_2_plen_74_part_00
MLCLSPPFSHHPNVICNTPRAGRMTLLLHVRILCCKNTVNSISISPIKVPCLAMCASAVTGGGGISFVEQKPK